MSEDKQSNSDAKPADAEQVEEKEGGMLPALLLAGVILGAVALLVVWPSGDDDGGSKSASDKRSASGAADGGGGSREARAGGGVQNRDADKASRPRPRAQINPAIKFPENNGIAPPRPKEVKPDFSSKAEEIAWYERKLEQAQKMRDSRQKFADRLPGMKERIQNGENPDEGLKRFEKREKIVKDNLARAEKKVDEIEKKLAELRGT